MLNLSILMSTAVSSWVRAPPVLRAWATVKLSPSSECPSPAFLLFDDDFPFLDLDEGFSGSASSLLSTTSSSF